MLQKSSIERVAEFFFQHPSQSHYLMDISRSIGLAHTSVKGNLIKLLAWGLIQERIEIRGLGSFAVRHYEAYTGRNPRTGESISVQPKKLPFFKTGKELKEFVDGKEESSDIG